MDAVLGILEIFFHFLYFVVETPALLAIIVIIVCAWHIENSDDEPIY